MAKLERHLPDTYGFKSDDFPSPGAYNRRAICQCLCELSPGNHGVTIFDKFCTLNSVPPLPVVIAENDICRDELLFEIEMDAIKTK